MNCFLTFFRSRFGKVFFVLCFSFLFCSQFAIAQNLPSLKQDEPREETPSLLTAANIEEAKGKIASEIKALSSEKSEYQSNKRSLLEQIQFLLERQVRDLATREALRASVDEDLEKTGTLVIPPKTFSELETRKDELLTSQAKVKRAATEIETFRFRLEAAKEDIAKKEKARRKLKESAEENSTEDLERQGEERRELTLAELGSRLASERAILAQLGLENATLSHSLYQEKYATESSQVKSASAILVFTETELEQKQKELSAQEKLFRKELKQARSRFSKAETEWLSFRSKSLKSEANQPERLGALTRAKEASLLRVDLLLKRIELSRLMRELWSRRFKLLNEKTIPTEIKKWSKEVKERLKQLDEEEKLDSARLAEFRKQALAVDAEIERAETAASVELRWLKRQRQSVREEREVFENYLADVATLRGLFSRFLDESNGKLGGLEISQKFSSAGEDLASVWNYEFTSIDDKPITVAKLVIALLLFIVGYLFSRKVSNQVRKQLLTKLDFSYGVASALESLFFYLLVCLFALAALKVANVPLTIFTILGGALAIGFGFGIQNIMNNFISGLILLLEQPIRVGDLVEIDALTGVVKSIGLRSTLIRTSSNIDLIVPNSDFLEKKVVNWTLADRRVRLKVSVGLAYGSDTEKASELLKEAVTSHIKVHKKPEPIVWFSDFADNSLVFEIHFWCSVGTMTEKLTVESDIRFKIDALFRDSQIVIAFPQRDVHLDTLKPLEVLIKGEK